MNSKFISAMLTNWLKLTHRRANTSKRRLRDDRHWAAAEVLEIRQVPAATAILQAGVLTINGSEQADNIVVTKSGTNLKVNGVATTFAAAKVQSIVVNAKGGNDRIDLTAVSLPTKVFGGAGNDVLVGGSGKDTLNGGAGNDVLRGNAGNDALNGGSGLDQVFGGIGNDVVDGGADMDTVDGIGNDISKNAERFLSGTATVDPHSILVTFRPGFMSSMSTQIMAGTSVGHQFSMVPGLCKIQLGQGMTVNQAVEAYGRMSSVMYVQPNYQISVGATSSTATVNDPGFNELYGLDNHGQTGGKVDADIDAPEAWNITTGSRDVIVAVIDSGIDYTHPDLVANIWTNPGEIAGNGIDDDANGYVDDLHGIDTVNDDSDPMDDHSHGTHVAGTIGASANNGIGVVGVAHQVRLMALKFLNSQNKGLTTDAIEALEYAVANGAMISNNSWRSYDYDQALYDAIKTAGQRGHLFVAAAGNESLSTDFTPAYPAAYDLPNIISVAATTDQDTLAGFSNYGATSVDLAAPGQDIVSTIPGGGYDSYSGTSMATPHVSGVAALARSLNPNATMNEIRTAILNGVDRLSSLNGKLVTGGRLNVRRTLELLTPPPVPSLAVSDSTVTEGTTTGGVAKFQVTLSAPSQIPVTLTFATQNDSATAGADYSAVSGTLTFNPGETTKSIDVQITPDRLVEGNERFFVQLSNPSNARLGDATGVGVILDDDVQPTVQVSVSDTQVTEGNQGTVNANFTITLSNPATGPVRVNYTTDSDSANSRIDYIAKQGFVVFQPGETSKTVTVAVIGDVKVEANEVFYLRLTTSQATLSDAEGQALIVNDDPPPPVPVRVSVNDVQVKEGNRGTVNAVFTITLSSAATESVRVYYTTDSATANSRIDYIANTGFVVFQPGETSQTVTVAVIGDAKAEANEVFYLRLTSSQATLSDAEGRALIINDD